jgi:hypothetical protein
VPGLHREMLDMVAHHHEYLDGSGYPHGLQASELSDLVRMITIADIFGALIERRVYKAPLSGEAAYGILMDMGPKLDRDLVREFRGISRVEIGQPRLERRVPSPGPPACPCVPSSRRGERGTAGADVWLEAEKHARRQSIATAVVAMGRR